jgi:signal transduction histidine kinase
VADAFRVGAADYVTKADAIQDSHRLGRAIREAVHLFQLEQRNTLLTRQLKLLNRDLEATNTRLKELTTTAHQIVDDVAHDFRTPLTVIQQYASILDEGLGGPVSTAQRDYLTIISSAVQDLSEMVDDFLDSSKLRAGALPVNRQVHTVQELFNSVEPMIRLRLQSKQIPLELSCPTDVPAFFADLSQASRVLLNLVVNAIKVTPPGHPLRIAAHTTETGAISVSVTDHGPGLRPDELSIIFDRFQQVKGPHFSPSQGFGLGLSIVKQLAWFNFGHIHVTSEFGKGSTFGVVLPAANLTSILGAFVRCLSELDNPDELWLLRIHPRSDTLQPDLLRRVVASSCYPMDLVWLDSQAGVVSALGASSDPTSWANRLQSELRNFERASTTSAPTELDIRTQGPWPIESVTSSLLETLRSHIDSRSLHA